MVRQTWNDRKSSEIRPRWSIKVIEEPRIDPEESRESRGILDEVKEPFVIEREILARFWES